MSLVLSAGEQLDCSSAEASLPSALLRMAWRTFSTPTFPDAAVPVEEAPCAWAAPALKTQAAARAAIRINAILEFTFFSL